MVWLVGLLVGCGPDRYDECVRLAALTCECLELCPSDANIAEECSTEPSGEEEDIWLAEDWQCFNDAYEGTCDEAGSYEECGL